MAPEKGPAHTLAPDTKHLVCRASAPEHTAASRAHRLVFAVLHEHSAVETRRIGARESRTNASSSGCSRNRCVCLRRELGASVRRLSWYLALGGSRRRLEPHRDRPGTRPARRHRRPLRARGRADTDRRPCAPRRTNGYPIGRSWRPSNRPLVRSGGQSARGPAQQTRVRWRAVVQKRRRPATTGDTGVVPRIDLYIERPPSTSMVRPLK